MRTLLFLLPLLITLQSCAPLTQSSCIYQLSAVERVSSAKLEEPLKEIALELCSKAEHPVIIPDFLELKSLKASSIGLMLGELLRSHYSQECKGKIIQVEFPKHFQLTNDGLIALTRNPELIKQQQVSLREAIIGTYSYTDSILRVFVRKIDVDTGVIKKMMTKEITLPNCPR